MEIRKVTRKIKDLQLCSDKAKRWDLNDSRETYLESMERQERGGEQNISVGRFKTEIDSLLGWSQSVQFSSVAQSCRWSKSGEIKMRR